MSSAISTDTAKAHVFFPDALAVGQIVTLSTALAHHLLRVLRLRPGVCVTVFNNTPNCIYIGTLLAHSTPRCAQLRIESTQPVLCESPLHITLAQSIGKKEKMDWVIQKSTELGITQIAPIKSQYGHHAGLEKPEHSEKKQQHWQRIALHAAQQCKRTVVPTVLPIQSVDTLLATMPQHAHACVTLDPHAKMTWQHWPYSPPHPITVLVGPEGGWSPEELAHMRQKNIDCIRLGPRTLRTETAGMVLLSLLQATWGDI